MIAEVLSLSSIGGFLAEILKAFLSDQVKEWAKPPGPEVKGKRAAFELYQALERLDFQMQGFIEGLEAVLAAAAAPDDADKEWRYYATCKELHDALREVLVELRGIDHIIRYSLTPALSIHRPEIIAAIAKVTFDRSQPLSVDDPVADTMESEQWKREFSEVLAESVSKLTARLGVARQNHRQIRATIDDFRQLLAREFSFKESFI